jgi:hypothetical protein
VTATDANGNVSTSTTYRNSPRYITPPTVVTKNISRLIEQVGRWTITAEDVLDLTVLSVVFLNHSLPPLVPVSKLTFARPCT